MSTILVVDDDAQLRRFLRTTLAGHGHVVAEAGSVAEAIAAVGRVHPSVILLDLGLPDGDGLSVLQRIPPDGRPPVIVLSARGQEGDKVTALDAGADDYLTKPFGLAELQARVRALLRRTRSSEPRTRDSHGSALRVEVDARRVYAGDEELKLTSKEFDVLAVLEAHRDKVVPRGRLMSEVWDENWYGSTKTLDVTIGRLRHKLEDAGLPDRVVAVRGVGFRLERTQAL